MRCEGCLRDDGRLLSVVCEPQGANLQHPSVYTLSDQFESTRWVNFHLDLIPRSNNRSKPKQPINFMLARESRIVIVCATLDAGEERRLHGGVAASKSGRAPPRLHMARGRRVPRRPRNLRPAVGRPHGDVRPGRRHHLGVYGIVQPRHRARVRRPDAAAADEDHRGGGDDGSADGRPANRRRGRVRGARRPHPRQHRAHGTIQPSHPVGRGAGDAARARDVAVRQGMDARGVDGRE